MPEVQADRRTLVRIVAAILLAAFGIFFLLSLVSYNPHDPPADSFPVNDQVQNICGRGGAWLSYNMRLMMGGLSYILAVLLAAWGIEILRTGQVRHLYLRLIGGGMLFASLASVLSLWTMGRSGGLLGLLLTKYLLLPVFRDIGSNIVALVAFFISLLVLTQMRIVGWIARGTQISAGWLQRRLPAAQAAPVMEAAPARAAEPPVAKPAEELRQEPLPLTPASADKTEASSMEALRSLSPDQRKRLLAQKLKKVREAKKGGKSPRKADLPPIDILDNYTSTDSWEQEERIKGNTTILENTLADFGIQAEVVEVDVGPVITQYELALAPGIKVGRIIGLADDIAMAVKAPSVRIVAPIPGKSTVGIEVPNQNREIVRMKEILRAYLSGRKRFVLPLLLGKDASGNPLFADLAQMPHLLIAGATGSGKSVCINAIIMSIIFTQTPDDVRMLLVDPKMVELSSFGELPHLMTPIVTDMKRAAAVLEWAVNKMDERYSLFSRTGVRNITAFNQLGEEEIKRRLTVEEDVEIDDVPFKLPHIIIIVDELADMMLIASKEVETSITRLSQKARAVGIHIIFATQRPSVDVVTGLIKANLPSRISFHVSSKVDSRTILDQNGAEKLLGMGDMLFLPPGTSKLIRAQGTYVSDEEIHRAIQYLRERYEQRFDQELMKLKHRSNQPAYERDEFYPEAVRIVLETERGSVSLLQRRLGIGYSRAARLIDLMAEDGIVGEYKGSQARETLMTLEEWEAAQEDAQAKEAR